MSWQNTDRLFERGRYWEQVLTWNKGRFQTVRCIIQDDRAVRMFCMNLVSTESLVIKRKSKKGGGKEPSLHVEPQLLGNQITLRTSGLQEVQQ